MNSAAELVLCVHSTGTGPTLWAGVPNEAVGHRPKLCPANLGYTPGALIERGRALTAADDAAHILRSVPDHAERIHVIAHSYGCLVALHAMQQLGDRVVSAFFYEPVLFADLPNATGVDPAAVEEARAFVSHPWFLVDDEKGGGEAWLEMFIDYWNRPGSWAKMPLPMRDLTRALGWKMYQEVRDCFFEPTPLDAWRTPTTTTIVRGARTTLSSVAMSQRLAAAQPHATLRELAGAGHMAPLTQPSLVHGEIAKHFARLDAG